MWFKKKREADEAENALPRGADASPMLIEKIEKDIVLVRPEGKIMGGEETTALCDGLRHLMNEGVMKVVMDFGKVTWINSAGIGVIMGCFTTLRRMGGNMKFANPTDKVKYYLQITKLNTVFEIFDTPEQAVSSFQ